MNLLRDGKPEQPDLLDVQSDALRPRRVALSH
jgi:hypothetical protein